MPCPDGTLNWRCPNCGGCGRHWYVEEVVPRECMTNALQEDKHTQSSPGWDVGIGVGVEAHGGANGGGRRGRQIGGCGGGAPHWRLGA